MTSRAAELERYKATDNDFTDFKKFEGDPLRRSEQRTAFINGQDYTPIYAYDQLDGLHDDADHQALKAAIYEAVLELEAAQSEPGANIAELTIYADYHALALYKIMLVEAARDINNAATASEREAAVRSFSMLNREIYGEYDTDTFSTMINTEIGRAQRFQPANPEAVAIKAELEQALGHIPFDPEKQEMPLMSDEDFENLREVVLERYGEILAVVPDTADDVLYDAAQCVEIMNKALRVGGLSQKGWKAVIDPKKSNPATNASERKIMLPSTLQCNANTLKRIIIHEQEVHARRGENGQESGFKPLAEGTASYADVEEGLGVILECAVAGNLDNPAFHRARDRYITAGLALGADGKPRDARQVYEILWRTIAVRQADEGHISEDTIASAKEQAYAHVENAFRGTKFWMQGVIYSKLKVYYEGLVRNAGFLSGSKKTINEALDTAMIGKHDHTDTVERKNIASALISN